MRAVLNDDLKSSTRAVLNNYFPNLPLATTPTTPTSHCHHCTNNTIHHHHHTSTPPTPYTTTTIHQHHTPPLPYTNTKHHDRKFILTTSVRVRENYFNHKHTVYVQQTGRSQEALSTIGLLDSINYTKKDNNIECRLTKIMNQHK